MDPHVKSLLHTLVFAVLFLILAVIVLPVTIKTLDRPVGQSIYGVMVVVGVLLALRLRQLAAKI